MKTEYAVIRRMECEVWYRRVVGHKKVPIRTMAPSLKTVSTF